MKRTTVFACCLALGAAMADADRSPTAHAHLSDRENPYVTSSNRLPARAVFVPAASMEEAIDIAEKAKAAHRVEVGTVA